MNLPNHFLADSPDAPLTPALVAESCRNLRRHREKYLAAQPVEKLIALLCEVAVEWRQPENKFRQLALEAGSAAAPAAVRRAPAPNTNVPTQTNESQSSRDANDEVVVGCARGGRAPQNFWSAAQNRFSAQEIDAAKSVLPILGVFALIPPFWSLFDQTNSTWVLQGEKMIPFKILGFQIGAEEMQSANPLMVMLLVPLLTLLIYPRLGKLASPLKRMSYGMFLGAFSYIIVAGLQQRLEAGAQLSIAWQALPYLVLTTAEVLVSTTGLEFAFREAAPEMKSLIMSFWLLTVTAGNLLVALITKFFAGAGGGETSITSSRFMMYAGLTFVVAIVFSAVASFYKYRDASAAEGK